MGTSHDLPASSASPSDPQGEAEPSPLFSIPVEILNKILNYLFAGPRHNLQYLQDARDSDIIKTPSSYDSFRPLASPTPAILLVCRRVSAATIPILRRDLALCLHHQYVASVDDDDWSTMPNPTPDKPKPTAFPTLSALEYLKSVAGDLASQHLKHLIIPKALAVRIYPQVLPLKERPQALLPRLQTLTIYCDYLVPYYDWDGNDAAMVTKEDRVQE